MKRKVLNIQRVSYSKDDTPFELRDYKIKGQENTSPAGTFDEWVEWANSNGYTKVIAWDKQGIETWERYTPNALK